MTTDMKLADLQPGLVADRNGEVFWFSGRSAAPDRSAGAHTWGMAVFPDTDDELVARPWRQVSVLSPAA